MSDSKIDPIIPISPWTDDKNKMMSVLVELRERFGFKKFLLISPENAVRLTGFPETEVYRKFAEFLLSIKKKLSDTDIQVGWWCGPTLKSGKADFQRITGVDGQISQISSCPLDVNFREIFARNVALVAEIAKPFIIQFEDDFQLSNHSPVKFGCFCPRHIKEFSRRMGNDYSRESLEKIFSQSDSQSIQMRKKWAQMSCDTLADFASYIRRKIDEVSPETQVSLCQSCCADFDGDFTEAVATAFAGDTIPIVRVFGSTYFSDDAQNIPNAIFNVHYSKENLPEHFELIHESDTYPHTCFFFSAAKLKSLMAAAFSYGMSDSLFYTTQYLDNPLEESAYSEMFFAEQKRFETIKEEVMNCIPNGCEICFSPWSHMAVPYDPAKGLVGFDYLNGWVSVLGKFGIPYSIKPGKIKMLAGNYPAMLSDQEIKQLLSSGVIMDGKAAHILSQRGFSDLIGAQISPGKEVKFCHEKIEDEAGFEGITGKFMYNAIFAPAGGEAGRFYIISPKPGAKILTSFCDSFHNPVMPGMISYENSLGGKIAITAFDLNTDKSSAVFNYRKKNILTQIIEWAAEEPLPIYVKNIPNVYCILNISQMANKAIATIINLCSDSRQQIDISVAKQFVGSNLEYLDQDGQWIPLLKIKEAGAITVPLELRLMEPVYLKLSKKD